MADEVNGQLEIISKWTGRIQEVTDADIPRLYTMVLEIKQEYNEVLNAALQACKAEAARRMIERKAKAIPDKEFEVELDPQYTPYYYDEDLLRQAASLLPPDEAVKVIKHVSEHTIVVPAKWEPGNPRSITALIKKYAGTRVSDLLEAGMKRDSLEPKVIIKPRATIKNVTRKVAAEIPTGASA